MTNNPKISVIVPVYNTEIHLCRCIDSILSQTYTDFEVLLVDDGSTDKSGDICDEYAKADKRVRTFHERNRGVSAARNCGLDNAKGEWITFCDSDDMLVATAFMTFMDKTALNVDIIKSGYQVLDENGHQKSNNTSKVQFVVNNKEEMLRICEEFHYCGFLWNSFIRKSLIGSYRFDMNISWLEDHIFIYTLMAKANSIAIIPDCTYMYFIDSTTDNNLSSVRHEFHKIVYASKQELKVKYALLKNNNELKKYIDCSFENKILKAALSSFYEEGVIAMIALIFKESGQPFSCLRKTIVSIVLQKKH